MEQFEHTIIFDEEINTDSVQALIDEMSSRSFVNLYLSTNGGFLSDMYALIDYLNYRHKVGSLRIYLTDYVMSAGTFLLTDYEGPIFLSKLFYGFAFHMPDTQFYTVRKEANVDGHKRLLKVFNQNYVSRLKNLGLTTKQIKDIEDGKDVYVFADEIHKLKRTFFTGVEEEITHHYTTFKF